MDHSKQTLIRRYYETYKTADRAAVEELLSPDFTFTSPYDDHIDRSTYFERCWAMAGSFDQHDLLLTLADGDDAVVHYNARGTDGATFRNVERFTFADDRIASIEVFFGLPEGKTARPPEDEIRTVLEQRKEAMKVKDARLVLAKHAPDTVLFSLAPPLVADKETEGGMNEAALNAWFRKWRGPIDWETRDVKITAAGDIAFVSALERMAGTRTDGSEVDTWFRVTFGLRKLDGEWKITHEHQSVPFYMDGSFRAATDLHPDERRHFSKRAQDAKDRHAPLM